MKNIEITIEKWVKAGLASAAICVYAFALASYALGRWHSLLVLPIGLIIGTTIQNTLGDSAGRWPARTAAVLTLLAGILAKAAGFYLAQSLDITRSQEFENRLPGALVDFTFSDVNRGDYFLFALSMVIAYAKAFRSDPATTCDVPTVEPASAGQPGGRPAMVGESAGIAHSAMPDGQEEEFSDLDVKRARADSHLTGVRIMMFLIGGVILYAQANVIINARKELDKYVRQELRHIPLSEIDPAVREQALDEGVRAVRLWAGGLGLIGIAYLVAGLLVNRFPIGVTSTALVFFAGTWATLAYLGEPMSPGANVLRIVVIMVLVFALHSFIEFRRECMRWIQAVGQPDEGSSAVAR